MHFLSQKSICYNKEKHVLEMLLQLFNDKSEKELILVNMLVKKLE